MKAKSKLFVLYLCTLLFPALKSTDKELNSKIHEEISTLIFNLSQYNQHKSYQCQKCKTDLQDLIKEHQKYKVIDNQIRIHIYSDNNVISF